MKRTVRIGSRESKLAVWQAQYVGDLIKKSYPEIEIEFVTMKTTGDLIQDRALSQIGGKGLFVKELDIALLENRIDISVHSLKDMPMETPEELPILAYSKREDPRDALLLREGCLEEQVETLASSSPRRTAQLKELFQCVEFKGIRGNVQTRIRKLNEGYCDGTILAAAGLKRLGMEHVISRVFETNEMIPAAGQGILAIQGRANENYDYLSCVMDEKSKIAALAERSFVRVLDGGCSSPIAAYATIENNKIHLTGLYFDETTQQYVTGEKSGEEPEELGKTLAMELKERFTLGD